MASLFTSSCCCFINQVSMFWLLLRVFLVSLVSSFVLLDLFCFLFVFVFFCGGFKGQVRWPEGPPHLALNPPCLFFLCFVFYLCFCFLRV